MTSRAIRADPNPHVRLSVPSDRRLRGSGFLLAGRCRRGVRVSAHEHVELSGGEAASGGVTAAPGERATDGRSVQVGRRLRLRVWRIERRRERVELDGAAALRLPWSRCRAFGGSHHSCGATVRVQRGATRERAVSRGSRRGFRPDHGRRHRASWSSDARTVAVVVTRQARGVCAPVGGRSAHECGRATGVR